LIPHVKVCAETDPAPNHPRSKAAQTTRVKRFNIRKQGAEYVMAAVSKRAPLLPKRVKIARLSGTLQRNDPVSFLTHYAGPGSTLSPSAASPGATHLRR